MTDHEDEHNGEELDAEGRLPCGHTPQEHDELARMVPVGAVNLTMTLPVLGYDPEDGHPIIDSDPGTGFGLLIEVEIPGPRALEVARNLLTHAIGKVDAGIAMRDAALAEGKPMSEEEINAAVAEFDPDAAISGLLNGDYEGDEGGHA